MQAELKGLQQRLGITFVFVTHDQGEALSMADRVAVFSRGRVEQLDTPRDLYMRPRTAFVASFVGSANVVAGDLAQRIAGSERPFAIRPELIEIRPAGTALPEGMLGTDGTLAGRAVPRRVEPLSRAAGRGHRARRRARRVRRRNAVAAAGLACAARLAPGRRRRTRGLTVLRAASSFLRGRNGVLRRAAAAAAAAVARHRVPRARCSRCCRRASMPSTSSPPGWCHELTLATYRQLFTQPANLDIVVRTLLMAVAVTIACAHHRASRSPTTWRAMPGRR